MSTNGNLFLIKVKANKRHVPNWRNAFVSFGFAALANFRKSSEIYLYFLRWVSSEMKRDETKNKSAQCQSDVWAILLTLRELLSRKDTGVFFTGRYSVPRWKDQGKMIFNNISIYSNNNKIVIAVIYSKLIKKVREIKILPHCTSTY